jgi:PBP1b-binding outer membrane lipoprotein LpoB
MPRFRQSLAALLIAGLISGGCHTPATTTVAEYRPSIAALKETVAPQGDVYQLVRWTPIVPLKPATQPIASAKPAPQMPVEIVAGLVVLSLYLSDHGD